jgi:hypothetical protein
MDFYDIGCCAGDDAESPTEMVRAQIRQLRLAAAARRMEGNAVLASQFDDRADELESVLKKEMLGTSKVTQKTTKKNKPKPKPKPALAEQAVTKRDAAIIQQVAAKEDGPGALGFGALLATLGIGAWAMHKSRLRGT